MRHQATCSVTPGSVKLGAMGKPCRQGLLRCFGQVFQRPETLKSTLMWEPPDSTQLAECCYVSEVSLNCSALTAARLTGPTTPQASQEASRLRWSLDNARLYDVVWYGMLHRTLATLASCYTRVWTCPTACTQVHMCVCVFLLRGPVTTSCGCLLWVLSIGCCRYMRGAEAASVVRAATKLLCFRMNRPQIQTRSVLHPKPEAHLASWLSLQRAIWCVGFGLLR